MKRTKADDRLMRAIAQRQPMLRLKEEKAAAPVIEDRQKPHKGGYLYKPLLAHPLDFGMEKFENDKAMRRLRLAPMEKRVEAAVALNLPWCVEELYMLGAPCDVANHQGWAPLHLAAARNFPECVRVLLNMRMDIKVNAITTKGYTPLYLAHSCQAPECAKMIYDAGGLPTAVPPMQGYRSILDMHVNIPSAVPFANRAADDRARNLNKPAYFGAY